MTTWVRDAVELMSTVLLVNNYHYRRGGAEVVYLQQSDLLQANGWKVAHFAMAHPKNLPSPWSGDFARTIEFGSELSTAAKLVNAGKIIYSREAYEKVGRIVERSGARLLHAHNIYHHLSPSVLKLAGDRGIPAVMTLHDFKLLCPSYTMMYGGKVCEDCKDGHISRAATRRCLKGSLALSSLIFVESSVHRALGLYRKNIARFISPSRFLIDKFVEWGWPRDRFAHIPNFIDASAFKPAGKVGQRFVYVGRLSHEKGIQSLIRATARARVALDVVGTGPDDATLRELAKEVDADVRFLGFQQGDALWRVIGDARAVVLPSEWYENAPISLLEAFALGKPVIGARIGGIPEMIEEDRNGKLFASGNVEALAERLSELARASDATLLSMGMRSREMVESRFSAASHLRALTSLYKDLGVGFD